MVGGVSFDDYGALYVALRELEPELHAATREGLLKVGGVVLEEAKRDFGEYDEASAEGFKVRVRAAGRVDVEQTKARTTGAHPDFGELMMRKAFLPAEEHTREEWVDILDTEVIRPLRARGF